MWERTLSPAAWISRQCKSIIGELLRLIAVILGVVTTAASTFEVPKQLERSKVFDSPIIHVKGLPNGGIAIGRNPGYPGAVLTNDLSLVNGNWAALVFPIAVQPDGRFIVKGTTAQCVWRLNWDGSRDPNFIAPAVSDGDLELIKDIAVQPDGKVVVGCFIPFFRPPSIYSGINNGLFRLNVDGTNDDTFQIEAPRNVSKVVALADGKLLISYSRTLRQLLSTGITDPNFAVATVEAVNAIVVQPNRQIIIAGGFGSVNRVRRERLARLESDGQLDVFFNPEVPADQSLDIISVGLQKDGAIVVTTGKMPRRHFPDGRIDTTFSFRQVSETIAGLAVDTSDRVYFNELYVLYQYSGRFRVLEPAFPFPRILEKSSAVDLGWSPIQTFPADAPVDYSISDYPGSGNTFYRARPAP